MELLHWDSYRKLMDTDSPLLNDPKLAQDYAFHINYFTNVPYFCSKGGCVTVAPEDLPSMVERDNERNLAIFPTNTSYI